MPLTYAAAALYSLRKQLPKLQDGVSAAPFSAAEANIQAGLNAVQDELGKALLSDPAGRPLGRLLKAMTSDTQTRERQASAG